MPHTEIFSRDDWFVVYIKAGLTCLTCCESQDSAAIQAEHVRLNYGVVQLVCSGDELLTRIMTEPSK
jgi:hypothetical protein